MYQVDCQTTSRHWSALFTTSGMDHRPHPRVNRPSPEYTLQTALPALPFSRESRSCCRLCSTTAGEEVRAKCFASGSAGPRRRQAKCGSDLPSPLQQVKLISPAKKKNVWQRHQQQGGHSPAESKMSSRGNSRRHGCDTSGHLESRTAAIKDASRSRSGGCRTDTVVVRGRRDSRLCKRRGAPPRAKAAGAWPPS